MDRDIALSLVRSMRRDTVGTCLHEQMAHFICETPNTETVIQRLTTVDPAEHGGRRALAGFYYQMLVAIEYLIEVMQGTWDFVAFELHEDVVVGKDNRIRFIQVKTKDNGAYTPADTELYSRSHMKNNSWIDRLLSMARVCKRPQFDTEFELVTSFSFLESSTVPLSFYKQSRRNGPVPADDKLLQKINQPVLKMDTGEQLNWEGEYGESPDSLLSRFYITEKQGLSDLEGYKSKVMHNLGGQLSQGTAGRVQPWHLDGLIGDIISRCADRTGDATVLYIDREQAERVRQKLEDSVITVGADNWRVQHTQTVLERIAGSLRTHLSEFNHLPEIDDLVNAYLGSLNEWAVNGGYIRELINQYFDGDVFSTVYQRVSATSHVDEALFELFLTSVLLGIIIDKVPRLDTSSKTLLMKRAGDEILSFLSLEQSQTFDQGVEKLAAIIQRSCSNPATAIKMPDHTALLQGQYYERQLGGTQGRTLRLEVNRVMTPENEDLPQERSIVKVPVMVEVIPGKPVMNWGLGMAHDQEPSYTEFRKALCESWESHRQGGAR